MSHFILRRSAFTNIQATLANWQGISAQSTDVLVHWNDNRSVIHLSFNGGSENHEEDDQVCPMLLCADLDINDKIKSEDQPAGGLQS